MGCVSSTASRANSPNKVEKLGQVKVNLDKNAKAVYEMIRDIAAISALPESFKKEVAQKVKSEWFKAGQVIMKQGEPGNTFYLISEGTCNVFMDGTLVSTLRSGDYMGEQALLKTIERTATVKALRPTRCFTMDNETFQNMTRTANLAFFDRQHSVNRAERKALSLSDDDLDCDDIEEEQMDQDTVQWLCDSVRGNVLFSGHDNEGIAKLVRRMSTRAVPANTDIVKQGDSHKADEFYVIRSGQCQVIKDGQVVDDIGPGAAFGELALVFNNPRSATVRSTGDCNLRVLTRRHYKYVVRKMAKAQDGEKVDGLSRIPLLATLTRADMSKFASTLQRTHFARGHVFFRQSDEGEHFYLISQGTVSGVAVEDGREKHFELSSGEFFGELALRRNQPRSATVMACTDVVCFVADSASFARLFGGFDNAMERQVEEYQKAVQSDAQYRRDYLMKRSLSDFAQGPIIGRGKYGLVQFVKDPESGVVYALKSVKKAWVCAAHVKQTQRRIDSLFNERNVMRQLNHGKCRFVVNLCGTFKDLHSVYFLMEAARGGDLFNVLKTRGYVDEKTARFYVACVVEAVDSMHSQDIIHRDLKPENIVLDSHGYAKLTDFGFAKQLARHSQKTYTLCGTPGYIAPEIILGQGYGKGSDWFAVGCVMFDMLTGQPPFPTRADQFSMIHNMMSNSLQLPMYLSFWAKDLLRNLIQLNSMRRFGVVHGGTDRIRNHKWFEHFDWHALRTGAMASPIKPKAAHGKAMDASNFDCADLEQMSNQLDAQLRTDIVLPDQLKNWDIDF